MTSLPRNVLRFTVLCAIATLLAAPTATAQGRPALELTTGWAGFVDDATINKTLFGGGVRVPISPRVSVGPEVVYMKGPGTTRDLMVTGNVTVDLLREPGNRPLRVVPYVVAGAGLFRRSEEFVNETFSSTEGAFTAGGGARVSVGPRVYLAPEVRLGWELHLRASVTVGVKF